MQQAGSVEQRKQQEGQEKGLRVAERGCIWGGGQGGEQDAGWEPSTLTSKRGFLPPASPLFSCNKSYSCELEMLSLGLPSPMPMSSSIPPGTSLGLPSPQPQHSPDCTLARVRCSVLWSLPRNNTALEVPGEPWLTGPAGRLWVSG